MYKLGRYTSENLVSKDSNLIGSASWIPCLKLSDSGLYFDIESQLELLEKWGDLYSPYFSEIRNNASINTQFLGKEYLHNNYYPTPDAEVYLSMIMDNRPRKILEIGSGFSTLIAKQAIILGKMDTILECIDPKPRTSIIEVADIVKSAHIEEIPLDEISLGENAILFIDSSHICRTLGDIPYLYCQLIPSLPKGTLVHVHDVYLPYDYPNMQQRQLYNETYLLHTLLSFSERYRILFSSHYISRMYPELMQKSISSIVATDEHFYGGSIWFQVC